MQKFIIILGLFSFLVVQGVAQEEMSMTEAFSAMAKNDTLYKVQFFSSKKYIHHFDDIENKYGQAEFITTYKHKDLFRYTFGEYYNDPKPAIELKEELVELGYTDAFVVAFKNGKRLYDVVIYKKYDF